MVHTKKRTMKKRSNFSKLKRLEKSYALMLAEHLHRPAKAPHLTIDVLKEEIATLAVNYPLITAEGLNNASTMISMFSDFWYDDPERSLELLKLLAERSEFGIMEKPAGEAVEELLNEFRNRQATP